MDEARRAAFAALRPLCTKLFTLDPRCIDVLNPLQKLLEDLPLLGLQSCLEYTLFPLLVLLDAAVRSRSKEKRGSEGPKLNVSDKLAEGVVLCLEVLLSRCSITNARQMTMLYRTLVTAAMLTPEEASEELRHGIIRCLKSMFQNLQNCSNSQCPCVPSPSLGSWDNAKVQPANVVEMQPGEECVIRSLQSEDMSASIGHLFSVLLQIAHAEAAKAGVGSGKLRADALLTLRVLMRKVCTADALAFFLPGIASGLGKVIKSARLAQRSASIRFYSVGAAGNSQSLEEAVRGIAELVVLVIADDPTLQCMTEPTPADALQTLQRLKLKSAPVEILAVDTKEANRDDKSFRVERNETWRADTVRHLDTLLSEVLPTLCAHPAVGVRLALAEAAGLVVDKCQATLEKSRPLLLETLLALACDDYSSVVSSACKKLLLIAPKCTSSLVEVLNRLLEGLPKALIALNDSVGLLHARRLAASMYLAGPEAVFSSFLKSPASLLHFISTMMQSFGPACVIGGSISPISLRSEKPALSSLNEKTEELAAPDQLPRPPTWFIQAGKTSLYSSLAAILRIAGLSSLTGSRERAALTDLLDPLQAFIRDSRGVSSFDTIGSPMPYKSGNSRQAAATATYILNEVTYGASGVWLMGSSLPFGDQLPRDTWTSSKNGQAHQYLVDAVGSAVHDYLELWELPVDKDLLGNNDGADINVGYLLQDNAALQQALVEGIGVFGVALGTSFEDSGFLGLVLYPLLEKLGCSVYAISHAASISLHHISHHGCYGSVRELVAANSVHVVDSLCRQLRHITAYPHAPDFLAAILKHTGAAPDLLPFLEEPMREILLELEIAGRHHHPQFIVPILKALREITKSAREGSSYLMASDGFSEHGLDKNELLERLLERTRCQRSVLTIATSGILSCAPLLASKDLQTCILSFDIIEYGMAALAKIEVVYNHGRAKWIEMQSRDCSEDDLMLGEHEDVNEGNKLLPTMHKVWPHLVLALRNPYPSVVTRCLQVIASVTNDCGGDFLARRFHKDALPHMLKLLQDGFFTPDRAELSQILQVRPKAASSRELSASPSSVLKVQEGVLHCFKSISEGQKSAAALSMVQETVAAWIVGVACSRNTSGSLRQLAMDTAVALSKMNADLVWILVADLVQGTPGLSREPAAAPAGFSRLEQLLPPLHSSKDALCCQYAGKTFDIHPAAAQTLFARLELEAGTRV